MNRKPYVQKRTFMPDRSQRNPFRRPVKRKNTVRSITFVRNWDTSSPVGPLSFNLDSVLEKSKDKSSSQDGTSMSQRVSQSPIPIVVARESPVPRLHSHRVEDSDPEDEEEVVQKDQQEEDPDMVIPETQQRHEGPIEFEVEDSQPGPADLSLSPIHNKSRGARASTSPRTSLPGLSPSRRDPSGNSPRNKSWYRKSSLSSDILPGLYADKFTKDRKSAKKVKKRTPSLPEYTDNESPPELEKITDISGVKLMNKSKLANDASTITSSSSRKSKTTVLSPLSPEEEKTNSEGLNDISDSPEPGPSRLQSPAKQKRKSSIANKSKSRRSKSPDFPEPSIPASGDSDEDQSAAAERIEDLGPVDDVIESPPKKARKRSSILHTNENQKKRKSARKQSEPKPTSDRGTPKVQQTLPSLFGKQRLLAPQSVDVATPALPTRNDTPASLRVTLDPVTSGVSAHTKRVRPVTAVPTEAEKPLPDTSLDASTARISEQDIGFDVRLWQSEQLKRGKSDLLDLDIVLNGFEELAWTTRNQIETIPLKNAMNRFAKGVQDDLRTTIMNATGHRRISLSHSKSLSKLNKKRKQLLEAKRSLSMLQHDVARLNQVKGLRDANQKDDLSGESRVEITT